MNHLRASDGSGDLTPFAGRLLHVLPPKCDIPNLPSELNFSFTSQLLPAEPTLEAPPQVRRVQSPFSARFPTKTGVRFETGVQFDFTATLRSRLGLNHSG